MTATTALKFRRLSTTLGAEVEGVDLSSELSDALIADIWTGVLEHKVLFFRGQHLDPDTQVAFTKRFGDLTPNHPVKAPLDEAHPEIWQIDAAQIDRNDVWHTDVTFVPAPPKASVLRAVQIPEIGGDTLWADLEAAYDSLAAPVQQLADQLTANHDGTRDFAGTLRERNGMGNMWDGKVFDHFEQVEHPVVRVHPETGRKSIFVNPDFTTGINGVSPFESRALLDLFYAHVQKPEHIVHHRWQPGDVVFWDNRNTQHYANWDYGNFRRIMQRVTLAGDVPYGPSSTTR